MGDSKKILSQNDEQLSEDDLMKYLDLDITEDERYEIEKKLGNDAFETDALQGLLQIKNKDDLQKNVRQLNKKLQQLTAKKLRKEKRKINFFEWIILSIIFLLFICIVTYVIINLLNKSHLHSQVIFITKHFSLQV